VLAEYVDALAAHPEDSRLHLHYGFALASADEPEAALREFRLAVRCDPASNFARSTLAGVLLQVGDADAAVAEYREALRLHVEQSDGEPSQAEAILRWGLANTLRAQGHLARARGVLAHALALQAEAVKRESGSPQRLRQLEELFLDWGNPSSRVEVQLREISEEDLPIFFEQQRDPDANYMAAFTTKDPADRAAFDAHWHRILHDDTIIKRTVVVEGQVAGNVMCHRAFGTPEVCYWLGREFWGRGVATAALQALLGLVETRPLFARAAADHCASLRVLEKCGFRVTGREQGYAHARAEEIEELILELDG
jgi:RimJ/RimL family protein N-acetyltransferase